MPVEWPALDAELTVLLAWRCCPADAKGVLECRVTEAIIGETVHVAWPSAVNEKIHPAKHMCTSKWDAAPRKSSSLLLSPTQAQPYQPPTALQ